jgi:hypothetical protein
MLRSTTARYGYRSTFRNSSHVDRILQFSTDTAALCHHSTAWAEWVWTVITRATEVIDDAVVFRA